MAPPDKFFSRVRIAREKLAEKALEWIDLQEKIVRAAMEAGDYETALKGVQFLMEHAPKDEDGNTLLEPSVDNKKINDGPKGPTIQIGIALGPVKALPPVQVIDVTDVTNRDS